MKSGIIQLSLMFSLLNLLTSAQNVRSRADFTEGWKFYSGDNPQASSPGFDDSAWRNLNLPHDWSIEGEFDKENPTKINGGALPAGIGWYRKTFRIEESLKKQQVYVDFDGVYRNSEVWINGHYLGKRPYGYSSFRYEFTQYLNPVGHQNLLAVRVDNSLQPNSRWYTGSGIYRNVWLVTTSKIHVDHWGTYITTPEISDELAMVRLEVKIRNDSKQNRKIHLQSDILNQGGMVVASSNTDQLTMDTLINVKQQFQVKTPELWSVSNPVLYKVVTRVYSKSKLVDTYETPFGIRYFKFDPAKGFYLNGKPLKILGVNNHHDLGALGAAVNVAAMERQLRILKEMGCNAIRMSHNPPAPELLDLCDRMGFIVIDEAFDCWAIKKMAFDYHLDWPKWHVTDLSDMVIRDRNHPSVFIWSIGNEIPEQFRPAGTTIAKELADIVKKLDASRRVTSGLTEQDPAKNYIYQSKALDLISFNYKQQQYINFPKNFPGENLLAAENISAFATRGHYDMPSDSIRFWPGHYNDPFKGNPDFTASAYDNVHAYWGSTHEETWKIIKNNDFISGTFIWSGFDFLGEPEPYKWPARSSYYGIIDLAGFPKDIYYFYQSEWTTKPVLHLFPHWNWTEGQMVDVWAYYNNADEVELFLNGVSQGVRSKTADSFHTLWRIKYQPGTIRAVSRKDGKTILEKEVATAGKPAGIELSADHTHLKPDGKDLSFITVKVVDKAGNMIPDAANLIRFEVTGNGFIAGVDNGCQTSMESFRANYRKAFNGMCLLIVQSDKTEGRIQVKATSDGLSDAELSLDSRK